ncbi:hypothetical protein COV82_02535 [Candidatus Peregrinibacteria bacterium CG11_big_fil_rev_8_21_14_0_20_46_8]|nr:MAG: hypothetical protein COV82_02535 [Candidatus Peregrinibacteria bacterium CG11_big_fil_rev_8_21_14_0_20_46_8]
MKPISHKKSHKQGVSLLIAVIFVTFFLFQVIAMGAGVLRDIRLRNTWTSARQLDLMAEAAANVGAAWAQDGGVGQNYPTAAAAPGGGGVPGGAFPGRGGFPRGLPQIQTEYERILTTIAADLGITCPPPPRGQPQVPCWGFSVIGSSVNNLALGDTRLTLDGTSFYSVPAPVVDLSGNIRGGGDALPECNPPAANDPNAAAYQRNTANDGCHWNKLMVGESVDIPLYTTTGGRRTANGGDPVPVPITANDLRLRVRTPCNNWNDPAARDSGCPDAGRIALWPDPDETVRHNQLPPNNEFLRKSVDPVLIQWQIIDEEPNGDVMLASETEGVNGSRPSLNNQSVGQNTEITAGRINAAHPLTNNALASGLGTNPQPGWYTIIRQNYIGRSVDGQTDTIENFITSATRPVLRLSMVARPRRAYRTSIRAPGGDEFDRTQHFNDSQFNVPYLEYQLLSQNEPISDPKSTVVGWVRLNGITKVFRKEIELHSPGGASFAIDRF